MNLTPHDQLSQLNVWVRLEHLMSYPVVRDKVLTGELCLSGWWFDVASGDMYAYDGESPLFEMIDRQMAEHPIARVGRGLGADGA